MKPWKESNKPHRLAMEFLFTIGKQPFAGGKPTRDFFKVWNFFKRLDESVLNLFHEYMITTGENPDLTMQGLFYKAQEWNQKQRVAVIKETTVTDYLKLLEEW